MLSNASNKSSNASNKIIVLCRGGNNLKKIVSKFNMNTKLRIFIINFQNQYDKYYYKIVQLVD